MPPDKKRIHFVGISGIGMSGIAGVMADMGYDVSGSDLRLNNLTDNLEKKGVKVRRGHRASNLPDDAGTVVYSSAVGRDNPELIEAARRKIPVVHRAGILAELLNRKSGIAVTGTHGKTTTTSLISVMLERNGLDPTVIIGGEVAEFGGNAKLGRGKYLVAEADESDGSFRHFKPLYSVITNIEMEHMDYFGSMEEVKTAYRAFAGNLKKGGRLFYNFDDRNIKDVLKGFNAAAETFGFSRGADIRPLRIEMDRFRTSFICVYRGRKLGRVELAIPGRHNVLNALAAILVGLNLKLSFGDIRDSIKDFGGAGRRFHLRADVGGVMLIDDYAHHPTEIKAVLDACRNWKGRRVIAVFQPHRFTRTRFLAKEFGRCFEGAGKLILTDIYAASEKPIRGVSVRNIYDIARRRGMDAVMIKKSRIAGYIMKIKRPLDMVLVLGAGDIKDVADELALRLTAEFRRAVRGKTSFDEVLARRTSFRIGGPADVWIEPKDIKDLKRIILSARRSGTRFFVMGGGTNLLADDAGFRGIIIHLGMPFFKRIEITGNKVRAGAGVSMSKLVRTCCGKGLSGLESLVGIPGTVGGAVFMNAGGASNPVYRNIGDAVVSVKVMDRKGRVKTLKKDKLEFGYRRSNLDGYIILEAALKLGREDASTLNSMSSRFLRIKTEKQALDIPSAGCVFKNPEEFQFTCGQMIDMLGLKGMRSGGAQISEKHANFIVNTGGATSGDVLELIRFIKTSVMRNYNVPLELEIKLI